MIRRLRIKFVLINMIIVAVILGSISVSVIVFTGRSLEQEAVTMMQTVVHEPIFQGIRPNDRRNSQNIYLPYFVLDVTPLGLITSTYSTSYDLTDEDFVEDVLALAEAGEEDSGKLSDYKLRYLRSESLSGTRYVFADISSEQSTLLHLTRLLLLVYAAALLVFLGISVLLARWAVRPVDQAWKQQKQFVADASHELKTPLTVIMTNAEMLQDPDCAPALQTQLTSNILVMSNQMRGLVESLLELARMDNSSVKTVPEDFNLSSVVTEALLPFEPLFFEKGLTLESDIEEGLMMHGSPSHLRQLTEILLDNAQKYCSEHAKTTVTLKSHGKHCTLTVADEGEPIGKEDLTNIFKRFYRVDKVRSMNHSYGLGLSIAQAVAEMHHGKIHAESADGVNSFIVTLPLN